LTDSGHPPRAVQPAPTPTFGLSSPIGQLRSFASRVGAGPICERLVRLSGSDVDPRFIGAIAAFLAHDEIIEILSGWAPENAHSQELEKLGRALWSQFSLVDKLRPFSAAMVARRELAQFRARRYLPVLLSARRPLPADSVAAWIQRLRTFLLIRALDAQEAGYELENNLLVVCRFLLPVCDQTSHDRRKLLGRLASTQTTFFDFVSETLLNAIQPSTKRQERRFVSALVNVLKGEKWAEAAGLRSARSGVAPLPPYEGRPTPRMTAVDWPAAPVASRDGINSPVTLSSKGNLGAVIEDEDPGKKRTLGQRKAQGEYLRLQHVEHSLFLRHTWHHLNEWEEAQLLSRIEALLAEGNTLEDRLGAALSLIAVVTSKTMLEVERLPVSQGSQAAWALDLKAGVLKRPPPRLANRWRADAQALRGGWIRPLGSMWEVRLADRVLQPLREAQLRARRATCAHELWAGVSATAHLKDWFVDRMKDAASLRRLTGPSTASVLGVHAFAQSQDHVFARLVEYPPAAPPGASAYAAYAVGEVLARVGTPQGPSLWALAGPGFESDINVCGSELDLQTERLRRELSGLTRRVDAAARSPTESVGHHNLLCALTAIALLASTGARPVSSPFESLAWFDFERLLVYVEDKAAGPTRGSRLCVLSQFAAELLQSHYLPHLRRLADELRSRVPEFAAEIDRQLARDPDARLPLLFFIRAKPTFSWIEVTETQLDHFAGLKWPLPWNCFRHLHSTQLRRWGLPPDIRDALLGHADRDAECHGFHSFRVPSADLETARPLVNRLQGELGFKQPKPANGALHIAEVPASSALFAGRTFGASARAQRRAAALANAKTLAARQIESLMGGGSVEALSEKQLEEIARRMLFRDDGMPHVMASVRYEVFEETLLREWQQHGRRAKLKRRYILLREGAALFTPDVIDADRLLDTVRQQFEALLPDLKRPRPRRMLAASILTIGLVLRSRVAHMPMLRAVILGDPGLRLSRLDGKYWLDWSFGQPWQPGRPTFRVNVGAWIVTWYHRAIRPGKRLKDFPSLPSSLQPLATALGTPQGDLSQLLKRLVSLRAQSNALHLSGVLAGYLAGARPSSALPESDAVRLIHSGAFPPPQRTEPGASPVPNESSSRVARKTRDELSAIERCQHLFAAVRTILASSRSREEKKQSIERLVAESSFMVGDVPELLCHFAIHLMERKHIVRDKSRRLAPSTVLRYWDSLAIPMLDAAADSNLLELDGDEITDLYLDMVSIDRLDRPEDADAEEQGGDQDEVGEEGDDDSEVDASEPEADGGTLVPSRRTALRLKEFHDYVSSAYGIDDPDWSELALGAAILIGRPGIVLRDEYLSALRLQLEGRSLEDCADNAIARAFVFVICARFGLRLKEAVGLYRRDVVDPGIGRLVILVASNGLRPLKTERSRRHVPQIESFEQIEREVIDETLRRWEHRHGQDPDTPILPTTRRDFRSFVSEIGQDLRLALKVVTRRSDATAHFLRHAYAMRVLSTLLGCTLGREAGADPLQTLHARKLLLGTSQIDRRLLWSVSRLLGHASPRITLYSYINCLALWLPEVEGESAKGTGLVIDLDTAALERDYLSQATLPSAPPSPPESLLTRYVRFTRLVCIGRPDHIAAQRSRISTERGKQLLRNLNQACEQLAKDALREGVFKLLGGLYPKRLAELAAALPAQEICVEEPRRATLEQWLDTIGRSRQIVLATEAALEVLADFVAHLGLTDKDVWLVPSRKIHASLIEHAEKVGLSDHLHDAAELGQTFQLDVARMTLGSRAVTSQDRLVAVAASGGRLKDSFELLLLWLVYLTVKQVESPATVT